MRHLFLENIGTNVRSETSYGIMPLRGKKGEWEIFLIHMNAGHWSFPKGHPEENESGLEAAQRELFEETGLQVDHLLSKNSFEEQYFFKREGELIKKKVVYFLAEVSGKPNLQFEEIQAGKWVKGDEAGDLLTFTEDKRLLQQVFNFLNQ